MVNNSKSRMLIIYGHKCVTLQVVKNGYTTKRKTGDESQLSRKVSTTTSGKGRTL